MDLLVWIFVFTLLGGVLSVALASFLLLIPRNHHIRIIPYGVSFALGALLSVAFLDLLPDAIQSAGGEHTTALMVTVLLGILGFFLLEKLLIWRHCHSDHCETHTEDHFHQAAGTLIVMGDAIHNLVDGVLIAAAFMTDIPLGVVTSIAVATHEIPQEVGDFAILLQSGYSPLRALAFNLFSSFATVVGGVAAFFFLNHIQGALPYILALAASSFIYIAVADLIPSLHKKTTALESLQQISLISAGVLTIYAANQLSHSLY